MSFLNIELNCSHKCAEWENILWYHYSEEISDDELWEFARESKEVPILGNVYQYLLLSRVLYHFCEETGLNEDELELVFHVNSIDTHLVINDWDICSVDDYWQCVEQNRVIQ